MENILIINSDEIINSLLDSLYDLVVSKRYEVLKAIGFDSNQSLRGKNMNDEAKYSIRWNLVNPQIGNHNSKFLNTY